jgi:thiol-disulfide isomerase/thioredoxin
VNDKAGSTVRVDSFFIPLSAIDRKTGDAIRFAYWGSSTKPALLVNSVGFETDRKQYWSHHLPHKDYHEITLQSSDLVIMPSVVPDGRQDDVPDGAKPEPLATMPKVGEVPPELEAEDWLNTDGALTLEALRGEVVVVEFWATWCGPCVAGIPHLNDLQEKYADEGLHIVSFTDQKKAHVEEFMKTKPMRYALGTGSQLSRRYGVTGIPHAFIVGRTGALIWHGHPAEDAFEEHLQQALRRTTAP